MSSSVEVGFGVLLDNVSVVVVVFFKLNILISYSFESNKPDKKSGE